MAAECPHDSQKTCTAFSLLHLLKQWKAFLPNTVRHGQPQRAQPERSMGLLFPSRDLIFQEFLSSLPPIWKMDKLDKWKLIMAVQSQSCIYHKSDRNHHNRGLLSWRHGKTCAQKLNPTEFDFFMATSNKFLHFSHLCFKLCILLNGVNSNLLIYLLKAS